MTFKLLVPPNSREVTGYTGLGDITVGRAYLLDIGQEPAVVVSRVLDMTVQVQDPVHILFMAKYIRALVT